MGAYLCIASNGIPPTVSKRIMLIVQCEYNKRKRCEWQWEEYGGRGRRCGRKKDDAD